MTMLRWPRCLDVESGPGEVMRVVAGPVASAGGRPFDHACTAAVRIQADDAVAVLRRTWASTAPGDDLLAQDHDLRGIVCDPPLGAVEEFRRVVFAAFERAGHRPDAGVRLRRRFAEAGIGVPDGTRIDGLVQPLWQARPRIEAVYRSVLPIALEAGLTTPAASEAWFAELAAAHADHTVLYQLLIGAWRRRAAAPEAEAVAA